MRFTARTSPRSLAAAAATALLGATLVAPALTSPATASGSAHTPVWDNGGDGVEYVAFGDSFASGPGIAPLRAGDCGRSEKNYASLVATAFEVDRFIDASCSGAVTAGLFTVQKKNGTQVINLAQLDALSPRTALVTFGTMGGNDIGLIQLATACVFSDCVPAAGEDPLASKFASVATQLENGIAEVKARAPHAQIAVIGYGTYLPKGGCPSVVPVSAEKADYLQGQIDRLSDLLEQIALDAGVTFVDQREIPDASAHTACSDPSEQWIRGLDADDHQDGTLLHPSTAGMKATGEWIVSQVTAPVAVPVPVPAPAPVNHTAKLRTALKSTTVVSTCRSNGRVELRLRGGQGLVRQVEFRAGNRRIAVDRKAPFVVTKKARTVRPHLAKRAGKLTGKISAKVTLRSGKTTWVRTVVAKKRPACLR